MSFGWHHCRQIIFFHCAIEQDYFFSQNQSKDFFFEKKNQGPPEYQMDRAS